MIEITDLSKEFMDRQIASGLFKDSNELVQAALEQLMRTQSKAGFDRKIEEAQNKYDRGEFLPWQEGDCERAGREYLKKRTQEPKYRESE